MIFFIFNMAITKNRVKDYFKYVDIAYRVIWRDKDSLGMHLGFWYNNTKSHRESLLNHNIYLAKVAKVKSIDIILDAGCGVGGGSFWLYKKFKSKIYGISISEKQIKKAKEYSKRKGIGSLIKFSVQDYLKTNFSNKKFTLIWAQESLQHEKNKMKFLKESYRLLKKRGRLVSSDYFATKKNYSIEEKKILRKFTDGWAMQDFILPEDFIKLAKKAGFKKVKYYDTTRLIGPSFKRLMGAYFFFKPIAETFSFLNYMKLNKANINSVNVGNQTYKKKLWGTGVIYAEK